MALIVVKETNEKDIVFKPEPLITNDNQWKCVEATNIGNVYNINSNGYIYKILEYTVKDKVSTSYMKIKARINSENNTLTTESTHKVYVSIKIDYLEDDENLESMNTITECYYPTFIFEESFIEDYCIIGLPDKTIIKIEIKICNLEEDIIKVEETGLWLGYTPISEIAKQIQKQGLIIPLIDRIEAMDELADGALCRCEWIEGVDY